MGLIDSFNTLFGAYNKMLNTYCKNDGYNEITVASYQYLIAVFDAKQITITKLSETLGVKKASVTQMIDGLVGKGYIKKVKSINDKRSSLIELTEKGSKLMESEDSIYKEFTQRISKLLTPQELEKLEELLLKLAQGVENFDSE